MSNPVSRWSTFGGMFFYFNGYAFMYFMPAFFQQVYYNYPQFASLNALCLSLFGFTSGILGGLICDRYKNKNPEILSRVPIYSAFSAIPFSVAAFLITKNFYLSFMCLVIKYLIGECWASPCLTLI